MPPSRTTESKVLLPRSEKKISTITIIHLKKWFLCNALQYIFLKINYYFSICMNSCFWLKKRHSEKDTEIEGASMKTVENKEVNMRREIVKLSLRIKLTSNSHHLNDTGRITIQPGNVQIWICVFAATSSNRASSQHYCHTETFNVTYNNFLALTSTGILHIKSSVDILT